MVNERRRRNGDDGGPVPPQSSTFSRGWRLAAFGFSLFFFWADVWADLSPSSSLSLCADVEELSLLLSRLAAGSWCTFVSDISLQVGVKGGNLDLITNWSLDGISITSNWVESIGNWKKKVQYSPNWQVWWLPPKFLLQWSRFSSFFKYKGSTIFFLKKCPTFDKHVHRGPNWQRRTRWLFHGKWSKYEKSWGQIMAAGSGNTRELSMEPTNAKTPTKLDLLDQLHRYQTKVRIQLIFHCGFYLCWSHYNDTRLPRRQEKDLAEHRIKQARKFRDDYITLKSQLAVIANRLTHPVMVPFGPKAFFPGQLKHTNEILVLLGDNWFAERSAKQAVEIVDRRLKR